jgi:hypothetical protein
MSMIFGKIDPVASVITQADPFNTTTVTGSYICAVARPYVLGTNAVNFQVSYGNLTFDESDSAVSFQTLFNGNQFLSGSAITSWGTDDAVVLGEIAVAQGTTVTEIIYSEINTF